jgi:hypothetical protein
MKKLLCLLIFSNIIFSSSTYSQNIIFEDTLNLKKGVYRTFDEFKFNDPSLNFDFNAIPIPKTKSHKRYKINLSNYHPKNFETIFGFCDGQNVYLCDYHSLLSEDTEFDKIQYLGIYSIFYEHRIVIKNGPSNSQHMYIDDEFILSVLDIKSGDKFPLNKRTIKKILSNDSQLLNDFNNSKNKNSDSTLIKFTEKYIKSNYSSIELSRKRVMSVSDINSFFKKTVNDSTLEAYYKRIENEFNNNPTFIKFVISETFHKNNRIKKKGIKVWHDLDGDPRHSCKIGIWSYYSADGKLIEEIEYNLYGERIK